MKYNIAICGTFNVENYGDVIFPEIFKKAMTKRGLDFDLFLISPGNTTDKTLAPGAKVYSASELNAIHKDHPLDAIIIGGGALIHYDKIPVLLDGSKQFSNYNIYDSWYTPIAFAAMHNIKVIFNLPQVPYAFPESTADVTKKAFDLVEYISVRDKKSRDYIEDVYKGLNLNPPKVEVYPDSVCCISELISKEYLDTVRAGIFDEEYKYAVLQFNPQKNGDDDADLLRVIERLHADGIKAVLLPLGYTHNDDAVLSEFNNRYGNKCITIDKKLNIFEMAAVLAGCVLYIGASFHGAITAISYKKAAISYNYIFPKTKNREIFSMYNVSDFVAENSSEVYDILDAYLSGSLKFNPTVCDVVESTDKHFDKIKDLICKNDSPIYNAEDFITPLIELLPQNIQLGEKADSLSAASKLTENHIKNLEGIIDNYKSLDKVIDEKNKTIDALENELQTFKEDILYVNQLKSDNETLRNQNSELSQRFAIADNNYNQILNSFFWKITSPFRFVTQFIKNCVSKNRKLLETAIFVKGFLRHGLSGGKIAVANYRSLADNTKVNKRKNLMNLKLDKQTVELQRARVFDKNIKFSILVPLYNTPEDFLEQMIESVKNQTYSNWELCLADGSDDMHEYVKKYCLKQAKTDGRIKYKKLAENKGISENTNECIKMSSGDYIALFDHDDILEPTVLYEYMEAICEKDADFIYCDEDKFEVYGGELFDANFKPDFAVDNLRANNYICHFTVFDKNLLKKCGTFRKEFDGSQDHDLVLRLTEQAKNIVHIPKVLYHWRVSSASVASDPYAKPYTIKAGIQAVKEHLDRVGLGATVESTTMHPNIYRIKYDIVGNPKVSIIIPNYNHVEELSRCIDSIINKSTYKNYEIIIVENNSDKKTFEYYETLKKYENIKVVEYKSNGGFNYSAINNYGVKFAKGEHYILLNNDVEVITPEWIEEMLMYSQRKDIGAVGAMLYYPDNTIQHAGVTIGVLTLAGHNFKHFPRGSCGYFGRAGYQQNVSAVTAACLMISADVYAEVGGLEESFAVAFNDIDFCMKIRKAGYLIAFTPFAELYHYESVSRGDDISPEKRARFVSEVEQFQSKWKKELQDGDPYYNPNLSLDSEDFSPKDR